MEGRVDFDDNEIVSVVSQQCVNISVYKIMLIGSLDNLHVLGIKYLLYLLDKDTPPCIYRGCMYISQTSIWKHRK